MEDGIITREYVKEDLNAMLDIFNDFAVESFSVYCEEKLNSEQFKSILDKARIKLVLHTDEKVIGFGFVSSYKPYSNFNGTGVLTYFILPEYTGKGLGKKLCNELISKSEELGITNFLAHVSSKNSQSLNFHKKLGFIEVGRFKEVYTKFNEPLDVVWFQKQLN